MVKSIKKLKKVYNEAAKSWKKKDTTKISIDKIWKNYHDIYRMLGSLDITSKQRKEIIDCMNPQQLGGFSRLVKDMIHTKRNLKAPEEMKQKLLDDIHWLKNISCVSSTADRKKSLLRQKAGFLPFLLPLLGKIAAPALGAIAGPLLGKLIK